MLQVYNNLLEFVYLSFNFDGAGVYMANYCEGVLPIVILLH